MLANASCPLGSPLCGPTFPLRAGQMPSGYLHIALPLPCSPMAMIQVRKVGQEGAHVIGVLHISTQVYQLLRGAHLAAPGCPVQRCLARLQARAVRVFYQQNSGKADVLQSSTPRALTWPLAVPRLEFSLGRLKGDRGWKNLVFHGQGARVRLRNHARHRGVAHPGGHVQRALARLQQAGRRHMSSNEPSR